MERIIKTPETDPEHHTIGRRFRAWDGEITKRLEAAEDKLFASYECKDA